MLLCFPLSAMRCHPVVICLTGWTLKHHLKCSLNRVCDIRAAVGQGHALRLHFMLRIFKLKPFLPACPVQLPELCRQHQKSYSCWLNTMYCIATQRRAIMHTHFSLGTNFSFHSAPRCSAFLNLPTEITAFCWRSSRIHVDGRHSWKVLFYFCVCFTPNPSLPSQNVLPVVCDAEHHTAVACGAASSARLLCLQSHLVCSKAALWAPYQLQA